MLYRDEGETFALQTRTIDRSGNVSEARASSHAPRASAAGSNGLKPPQKCVPEDVKLDETRWTYPAGFRYRQANGNDITKEFDTKVYSEFNLPDCRWARTLGSGDVRPLTQDGSPIIKTKKGSYAFGFRALQDKIKEGRVVPGDFVSGPILSRSDQFVGVYDSYGNPFAFLRQPADPMTGQWTVSDHEGEPDPGGPGTGRTKKGVSDAEVELQVYGRGCNRAKAPDLREMVFVNFKAIPDAVEPVGGQPTQRLSFRGFIKAVDLKPRLGLGKNRITGVRRATMSTWEATAEFDSGCDPRSFTQRFKDIPDNDFPDRADVPYRQPRGGERTSFDPPPNCAIRGRSPFRPPTPSATATSTRASPRPAMTSGATVAICAYSTGRKAAASTTCAWTARRFAGRTPTSTTAKRSRPTWNESTRLAQRVSRLVRLPGQQGRGDGRAGLLCQLQRLSHPRG